MSSICLLEPVWNFLRVLAACIDLGRVQQRVLPRPSFRYLGLRLEEAQDDLARDFRVEGAMEFSKRKSTKTLLKKR